VALVTYSDSEGAFSQHFCYDAEHEVAMVQSAEAVLARLVMPGGDLFGFGMGAGAEAAKYGFVSF
jgi:hypothetical protein